jgi:hypothetical protein
MTATRIWNITDDVQSTRTKSKKAVKPSTDSAKVSKNHSVVVRPSTLLLEKQGTPVMMLGKTIQPGRFITVDSATLANAHKLNESVAHKLVFVGQTPPTSYVSAKTPMSLSLPKGMTRSHGKHRAALAPEAVPTSTPIPQPNKKAVKTKRQTHK